MADPEEIATIAERTDLVELIQESIPLKKAGADWTARCPFHAERTPSFSVIAKAGRQFYYCLGHETRVMTSDGPREIGTLRDRTVEVLGGDGRWTKATFRAYGEQQLYRVNLSRNGVKRTIRATAEHRWWRRGRTSEITTLDLKPGDRLQVVTPERRKAVFDPEGFCAGIVKGDGTTQPKAKTSTVVLHGKKLHELGQFFDTMKGNRACQLPKEYKTGYPSMDDIDRLASWVAGIFAADGSVCARDGSHILEFHDPAIIRFIRKACDRLGWLYLNQKTSKRTKKIGHYDYPDHGMTRMHLVPSSLPEWFLVRPSQRESAKRQKFSRLRWAVESVEPDAVEEVYCTTIPEVGSFVLEDYILTGNCFGCGAAGDAIKWVREYEGATFGEALERLAIRAGLPVPQEKVSPEEQARRERKRRGHDALEVQQEYNRLYYEGSPAQEEADRRGIPRELQEQYGLGFCIALDPTIDLGIAIETGIVKRRDDGSTRLQQQDRWTFPIRNPQGRTLGWSGRALREDHKPKYLNTSQTEWFDKGKAIFGIDVARRPILRSEEVVLVEGNVDVIMAVARGIPNTVALLGTGCTRDHAQAINRMAQRVVLCYDPDKAGKKAQSRTARLLHEIEIRTRVVNLEQDPADTPDLKARVDDSKDYFQARWDETGKLPPAELAHARAGLKEELTRIPGGDYRDAVQAMLESQGARWTLKRAQYRPGPRKQERHDTTLAVLRAIRQNHQMRDLDPDEFTGTVIEEALKNPDWLQNPSSDLSPYCAEILAHDRVHDPETNERAIEQWRREEAMRLLAREAEEPDPGKRLDLLQRVRRIAIKLSE